MINITDVKIRKTYQDNRLRALVSITINDALAIHDIKIIEGPERIFVAMPSRREENGTYRDIVHPILSSARKNIEDVILQAYHDHISYNNNSENQQDEFAESNTLHPEEE